MTNSKAGARFKTLRFADGTVVRVPKIPVSKLRGVVKAWRLGVTVEDMAEGAAAGAAAAVPCRKRR